MNPTPLRCAFLCALVATALLPACATLPGNEEKKDFFRMEQGLLYRNDDPWTMQAQYVQDLGRSGGAFSIMVPALARIAESGGNTVAFDLAGWNTDCTALDPAAVETVRIVADRTQGQRMGAIVNVLGGLSDAALRETAVVTAAKALRGIGKAVYLIDGTGAEALAATFKHHAPGRIVVAPAGGDLRLVQSASGASVSDFVWGAIPELRQDNIHFLLPGFDGDYLALEEAMKTPEERAPWTPDNSVLSAEEQAEGFIALFNGKNLDGWRYYGENKNGFRVTEAGEIEWVEEGGDGLLSHDRYSDFVLRLEFKIAQDGNSGIYLRAPRTARQSKIGMEFQIRGDYGMPPGDNQTGAIYVQVAPKVNAGRPAGEWNAVEIALQGSHMKAVLNGQVVQDINLDENEELRYRLRRGFIGLQDHDCQVSFRNIRLKPL
ncbi:MAG: DUF1080 domain-containing protein [Candidatus Hydrogenedentes bacterium]|nr:DUF1080 domain-containing protein [Candidatus Hydrogenedentota bacterium]